MDLIIKPTELCNFKCTFCSSTNITEDKSATLDLNTIFTFLERFPDTRTIIVNGGDPLMVPPSYYFQIIEYLDDHNLPTTLSLTSNLWPFYKNPNKWAPLFNHSRVGVTTSFQYGAGRLKGDGSVFTEEDFWNVSDTMLELCGYRPGFISVITNDNISDAIKNVELAQKMDVECKLNYAMSSGPPVVFKGITMGQRGKPLVLADIYEVYIEIWKRGLQQWEFNTKQMAVRLKGAATICPQTRSCDENIRTLQPSGDYYSCGAFGDDREFSIDFNTEMKGEKVYPLRFQSELMSMHDGCFTCSMFDICNGCRKTIKDHKDHNIVDVHCKKMKSLAADIININRC